MSLGQTCGQALQLIAVQGDHYALMKK